MLKDLRPFREPMFLIAAGAAAILLGVIAMLVRMAQ